MSSSAGILGFTAIWIILWLALPQKIYAKKQSLRRLFNGAGVILAIASLIILLLGHR